jgi:hypothetical protein
MSNKAKAVVFWAVAIVLSFLTTALIQVPGWVWALRIIVIVLGVALTIGLIAREDYRKNRGLPLDRDSSAFDLWTIAHTTAGLVMGAWGIPFPLVVIFTIAWEIFEFLVPGFGDTEIFSNRIVDIAVAWVGWIVAAGIVALATQTEMPWLLPSTQSLVRDAGLHLF